MNIDVEQYLVQAKQAEEQKQWLQAIECYKKLLEVFPNHQLAKEGLAWCLSLVKSYNEAINIYQDLEKSQPEVAKWPYAIGYQYQMLQKWQKAIEWYDQALKLTSDYIAVLYRKGYSHTQLIPISEASHIGAALRTFELCRKLWHELPEGPQKQRDKGNCAKASYHQAKALIDYPTKLYSGAIEAAIILLKEATQLDPDDHNKHYLLGKAYLVDGQYEQALAAFQEADRLEPNQDCVLDKWAEALLQLDRLEDALKIYLRIPIRQRKDYILRNLGCLYHRLNRYDEAVETLQLAVRKNAQNHNGHYYLGLCYHDMGKLSQAAKELLEAIQLKRRFYKNSFPEAQKAIDELLAHHPELAKHGTISEYRDDRGFGFIESDAGKRIFFHIKDCRGNERIGKGFHVEFEEVASDKGPRAILITCIGNDKNIKQE